MSSSPPQVAAESAWRVGLLAGVLLLLAFTVYWPSLLGDFLWDDPQLISENPLIRDPHGRWKFFFSTEAIDYWPITNSMFWVEWRVWDHQPAPMRATNVLLHAFNAVLIWRILRQLACPGAFLAAALFLVHPMNVASVAWIAERKNSLSLAFLLPALVFWLDYFKTGKIGVYLASLIAFALALLSKTAVVMFPVVLLGYCLWQQGRIRRRDGLALLPFFLLSAILGAVTIYFQHLHGVIEVRDDPSLLAPVARAGWVVGFYLYKAFWPPPLMAIYPRWSVHPTTILAWLPWLGLIGLTILLWIGRRSWGKPWLVGGAWFLIVSFPVWGLARMSYHKLSYVGDHLIYPALIGLLAALAASGAALARRSPRPLRLGLYAAGVGLVALWGVWSFQRAALYASNDAFWQDAAKKNPQAFAAWSNLAVMQARAKRDDLAEQSLRRALELEQSNPQAHLALAQLLERRGDLAGAQQHLEEAVRIAPWFEPAALSLERLKAIKRERELGG